MYDPYWQNKELYVVEEKDRYKKEDEVPIVLKEEFIYFIWKLPDEKLAGCDELPAEVLSVLGEGSVNRLKIMVNKIYVTGPWTENSLKIIMVTLLKKNDAKHWMDYKTVSLMSYAANALAKVDRINGKI